MGFDVRMEEEDEMEGDEPVDRKASTRHLC